MTHRIRRTSGRFLLALAGVTLVFGSLPAGAAQPAVGLGTAGSFGVLAATGVTNTGNSVINGDLGVHPGTSITGFPPGIVNGTQHSATPTALQAKADASAAYNDAAGRSPFTMVATELGGTTLAPGVYRNSTLGLTGTVTLDAAGDPNAVFIFQAGSTVITAASSRVSVINGGQACNVFWQVGSSATLGAGTQFVGTVLARTSITAGNSATVQGRLLALDGAVTLDTNTVTRTSCAAAVTTTTTSSTTTTTVKATTTTTAKPTTTTTTAPVATGPTGTPPDTGTPTAPAGTPVTDTGAVAPVGGVTDAGTTAGAAPVSGAGSGGGGSTGVTAPQGDDDSSTLTELPYTGSTTTAMAVGGVLAVLAGAVMVHGSNQPQPQPAGSRQRAKSSRRGPR